MTDQMTARSNILNAHDGASDRRSCTNRRVIRLIVAAFVPLVLSCQAAVAGEVFHGQVAAVYGTQLRLSTGGLVVDFRVADCASVTLDGRQVSLYDLTPDCVAFATAIRERDQWTATVIDAWSQRHIGR